ncbi:MAG: hypothetical protein ACFB01_08855 [Cohaesibacteraceae bacterium]
MAEALRRGVSRLETTTKLTLAILALASGVYTYLGVRGLLQGIGPVVFFGALVYSTAVSIGIYAFWSYLIQFTPHIKHASDRRTLIAAMALGSMKIVAMSSWLNAAALAGGAAIEQHLANTTEEYQARLTEAHNNALAAQGLLPDIQLATERFRRLAQEERLTGSLTGTSGSGTVVQLLNQMAGQLDGLAAEVRASRVEVDALFEQGGRYLGEMRRIVSAAGPIEPRAISYAEEAVALSGVIAAMSETSIAPAVRRAAEDLAAAFVAPEVDGQTSDLASRQEAIVGRVESAIGVQSAALASAADGILSRDPVQPVRFVPLSTPEAVLLYADEFLPSWAGAISIDLLPAVLIVILAGVHSAIRREEGAELDAHHVTVAEMTQALRLYQAMQPPATLQQPAPAPDMPTQPEQPDAVPDEPERESPAASAQREQPDTQPPAGVTPLPTFKRDR